ncbi:MAG: hypothetical protein KDA68_23140 [Planctomycetaceae bacterium]|nr:hypothetical protein [Planctomycetaceae bacterium]
MLRVRRFGWIVRHSLTYGSEESKMGTEVIDTFEKLEVTLRNWRSFKDREIYDINGMAALLAACLDNLKANMQENDYGDFCNCFSVEQRDYLRLICDAIEKSSCLE